MFRKLLLASLCLLAPSIAHADWHEASSKHFVVYADEDPGKLKTYIEQLERFDLSLRFITGTPDKAISPHLRVHVFVVGSLNDLHALARRTSVAGYYIPRAVGPVAFVPESNGNSLLDAQTILQHEYAHSFMYASWPSVVFPKWFSEGFAEFVGTGFYRSDGTLVIGRAPAYRAYGVDRTASMPARRLLSLNPKDEDMDTQTLYGRGWLLTHYALLGGHADQLIGYIQAINAGKSIDEANKAFGDLGQLDGKLNAYAKRRALSTIALGPDKVKVGDIDIRRLTPGETATMKTRIYSTSGVDPARAKTVVGWARTAAAPYPKDAGAQNALAEAEFDAGDHRAAEAAADRALAADPKSIHALLYKGMARMEMAKAAKEKDSVKWREIRNWFIKANRLDTEYPWPLMLYYESFGAAGEAPSKSAMDGIIGAYVKAPFDNGLRYMAAKVLIQQNNLPQARIALEKLAYGPHQGNDNVALKMLTMLDEKGGEAALKMIDEEEARQKEKEKKAGADKIG